MKVEVPVLLAGIPVGVKVGGGILDQVLREVEIECLPADIPKPHRRRCHEPGLRRCACASPIFPMAASSSSLPTRPLPWPTSFRSRQRLCRLADEVAAAGPAEPEVVKKGKQDADAAAAAPAGDKKAAKK